MLDNLRFMCTTPSGLNEQKFNCYKEKLLMEYSSDNSYDDIVIKAEQADRYLQSMTSETAVVCGYITDSETGDPIENAHVYLHWTYQGGSHENDTFTSSMGFYSMNVEKGYFRLKSIYASGYWIGCTPYYFIDDYEILWLNKSLDPLPPENSVICGYVNDVETGDPLEGARVDLDWEGNINWNTTYTDASGFYSMNVAAGELELDVHLDGYLTEFSDNYNIGEYEILWLNFSMYPMPPINSYIQGFVTDTEIGEPIVNVLVRVIWHDEYGHNLWFNDYTNDSGYYNIHTVAGEIRINARDVYYYEFISDWFFIEENEHLWFNFSMEPYNYPPYPPTINGPTTGKPHKNYEYTFVAIDPEDDDVYYDIYWGGPVYLKGLGPYASGEEVKINLSWFQQGTYYIRARAVDEHGNEGEWSFLTVTMPRNREVQQMLFYRLLECFPLIGRFISRIINPLSLGWFVDLQRCIKAYYINLFGSVAYNGVAFTVFHIRW